MNLNDLKGSFVPLVVPFVNGSIDYDGYARICEWQIGQGTHGLLELFAAIDYDTSPITTKYMLRRIGVIDANEHRLPMTTSTPELERGLDFVLTRAQLI